MREGLEVRQDALPAQGGWMVKVAIALFGVWREGIAFDRDFSKSRERALEEALRLWDQSLESSEAQALRQALASPTHPSAPEPGPDSSKPREKQGTTQASPEKKLQAQKLLLKLLEALRKSKGEEAVMEAFAEAELVYPQIPEEPEEIKRLYALARKKLS